jgi:hypothetical protein
VIDRRQFLRAAGATVSLATVVAACGGDGGDDDRARPRPPRTVRGDIGLTRTTSSLEHVAVTVYTTVIDSGLLPGPNMPQLARLFRSHHESHAQLFVRATRDLGGRPFDQPNPAVLEEYKAKLGAMQDEMAAAQVLLDVEQMVSQTSQSLVARYRESGLSVATMSVGGADARHAAALAAVLSVPPAQSAFQPTERAVEAGIGV